jgi:alanine dehydrogenase
LLEIGEKGGVENALRIQEGLKNGVYLYRGIVTSKSVSDWFQLPHTNINLLLY